MTAAIRPIWVATNVHFVPQRSKPALFLGSSSEGRDVARHLQTELGDTCEVERWDQDVFTPSGYALESLLEVAQRVDFAVIVATPDDTVMSRGKKHVSARDNIVLEFGLFAGALGRERTYLLATGELKLPTDVLGLTRLPYHPERGGRASVTEAALRIEDQVKRRGPLPRSQGDGVKSHHTVALTRELDLLCGNAIAQGWAVKKNNETTLRLTSPRGRTVTLAKGAPELTREDLRRLAGQLRANGLRINSSLRRPVADSPFQAGL